MRSSRLAHATLALIALCVPATVRAETLAGEVTRIRDGDTIEVDNVPIRLNGLHAPERGDPGGAEATEAMRQIVEGAGGLLRCELSGEMSYDRYIGVCYTEAGQDIAALLIARGLGRDCPRYSDGRYADFERAEAQFMSLPAYCLER